MAENINYFDSDIQDKEMKLKPIIKKVWDSRRTIIKWYISVAVVVGLIVAFSIHNEYTAEISMAPEGVKTGNQSSGMADIAALAGIDLRKKEIDGINLTLYPNIVNSIPFRVALADVKVQGEDMDAPVSLYDYIQDNTKSPWWNSVISLPFRAIGAFMSLFQEEAPPVEELNFYSLSKDQMGILDQIKSRIGISIDSKMGIIQATATMQDPQIAAQVVDTVVARLNNYMASYFTKKSMQNLDFVLKEYNKAQPRYYAASKQLAKYVDENRNIFLQSAAIERKQLEDELSIAYSTYAALANQLEQAKMSVQKETPVVTIIDPARIPEKKSNTSKAKILIIVTLLGGFIGVGTVVYQNRKELF